MTTTEPPTNAEALAAATDDELVTMYQHHSEQSWRQMSRPNLLTWQRVLTDRGLATRLQENLKLTVLPHTRAIAKVMETAAPGKAEAPAGFREQWEQMKATLKPAAEMMGLVPKPRDPADRLYFTRLANDPRHPMTMEMVEALMALSHVARKFQVEAWLDDGSWNVNPTTIQWLEESVSVETDKVAGSLLSATESSSPPKVSEPVPSKSRDSTGSGETSTEPATALVAGPGRVTDQLSSRGSSGVATPVASILPAVEYLRLPLSGKRDAFVADGMLYVNKVALREWVVNLTPGTCCLAQRSHGTGQAHSYGCWVDALR